MLSPDLGARDDLTSNKRVVCSNLVEGTILTLIKTDIHNEQKASRKVGPIERIPHVCASDEKTIEIRPSPPKSVL